MNILPCPPSERSTSSPTSSASLQSRWPPPTARGDGKLRIVVFGAPPDDAQFKAGGTSKWAKPGHRVKQKFALLREVCENYDLDGLELDFLRFYSFFRTEETTREQRCAIITGFVREVRALLDRTARAGRRRWLCARVPCYLPTLDLLGLAVARHEPLARRAQRHGVYRYGRRSGAVSKPFALAAGSSGRTARLAGARAFVARRIQFRRVHPRVGDNGAGEDDKSKKAKGTVTELGARTPCVIRGPAGVRRGVVAHKFARLKAPRRCRRRGVVRRLVIFWRSFGTFNLRRTSCLP